MITANFVPFIFPSVKDSDLCFNPLQEISAICMHGPKFSDRGYHRYEPQHTLFKILKNSIQMRRISWTFSVFRKCISLCVCSDSCVKVLHRNFGWTNRDQESRIQKKSLAIVSLSQWQHLSRHSHSQCSAWSLWISQSEDSRLYKPGYLAKRHLMQTICVRCDLSIICRFLCHHSTIIGNHLDIKHILHFLCEFELALNANYTYQWQSSRQPTTHILQFEKCKVNIWYSCLYHRLTHDVSFIIGI